MNLREFLIKKTGYYIYKKKYMPYGIDWLYDLKNRLDLNANIIFDVGANVGQSVLKILPVFHNSTIYSFEPVNNIYDVLYKRFSANKNVKCYDYALGDFNGEKIININEGSNSVLNSLNDNLYDENGNNIKVKVITGDTFCFENNIPYIDILKIDTEGFEINVLNGFKNMLGEGKIESIFCEMGLHPQNKRNTYIIELYNYMIDNNYLFISLYDIANRNYKIGNNYGNMLWVKK